MNYKQLAEKLKKQKLVPGHRSCAGCGFPQIVRATLASTDKPVVASCATGCLEVTTTIYPFSSWNISFIHSAFENSAATIAGAETAYRVLKKKGKIKEDIKFVAFGGDGGCYIPKTKILTINGFKNVEELKRNEVVLSVNPKTLELEPSSIVKMHKYNYHDKIVKVNHNFAHFNVTLNHNIPIFDKFKNKVEIIKAHKLLNYGRSDRVNIITGNLKWKGKDKKYFKLPKVSYHKISGNKKITEKIRMKGWLEFFGYWISEGHLSFKSPKRERYNIFIAQTNKEERRRIESCLNRLPFNFWKTKDRFGISNQQLWTYLKQFSGAKNKFIPLEFRELNNDYLKILFDALIFGDGSVIKRKGLPAFSYSTISERLKDSIIEIALKLGYRVHLDSRKRKGRHEFNILVSQYKPTTLANLRRKHISCYNYHGKVYCPELNKNHILIIEKDGRISLNMNSFDIGLQSLSGAVERGHDFLYVCYSNGAYMNTGVQRSSATPLGASTTTSPAGKVHQGKEEFRKDFAKVMVAHNIPYVAQASVSNLIDLTNKAEKAFSIKGPKVLVVLQPCTLGWRFPQDKTIEIAKLAVETKFWPLYEVENGKYKLTYKPSKDVPVIEFIKTQGRFKHLLKPENKHIVDKIQEHVDKEWGKLVEMCGEK